MKLALANSSDDSLIHALSNALEMDADGWALVAPFGEHPLSRLAQREGKTVREDFIQVFDRAAAEAIVGGPIRKLKRAVVGIPVFMGHPDLKLHSPETVVADRPMRSGGVIDKLRIGERGLQARFVLTNDGADAVEAGTKFPSVLWWVNAAGTRDGKTLVTPTKLISIGLTPFPNISGVDSLANAKPNTPAAIQQPTDDTMKQLLMGWLAAQGIALANEATEQQVLEAIQKTVTAKSGEFAALANEKSTLATKAGELETANATLKQTVTEKETALANAQTEIGTLKTAVQTERKARAEALVDLAIAQGKLAVAERETRITALANSAKFDDDAKALANEAVKHPVGTAKTDSKSKHGADAQRTPREQILALANSDDRYKHLPWDQAFAAILKDNPSLAEQMRPAAK